MKVILRFILPTFNKIAFLFGVDLIITNIWD